jgi:hypothetical protein
VGRGSGGGGSGSSDDLTISYVTNVTLQMLFAGVNNTSPPTL